jgi:hypothetical protein
MDQRKIWLEIIEEARYSPSPHNIQPWKMRLHSDLKATLLYDPARLLPEEDVEGCFTLSGFGIFLEYMAVISLEKGFKLHYVHSGNLLDRNAAGPQPLFQLTLTPSKEQPIFQAELVRKRRTSRLPYNDKKISPKVLDELRVIAADYGHEYTFSQETELVKWVVQLNCDTLFYDMDDDLTRGEVASWVRYTKRDASLKKDGLAAFCLNIPGVFLRIFFKNHRLLNLPLVNPALKRYYLQTMRGTKTVGWLSGPFKTPADWLNAGHMLGRIWLKMTEEGIYLHPFGSTITNKRAHQRLLEKFSVDESTNTMWLIMRLGHSDLPPRSARLEAADILIP